MFGVILYSPWWRLRSNNVVVVVDDVVVVEDIVVDIEDVPIHKLQ